MPDWEDVKDMYEVEGPAQAFPPKQWAEVNAMYAMEEPAREYAPQPTQPDGRCLRVELPGLPRFMTLPGLLQPLVRKKAYRMAVQYAFATRMDKLPQGFSQIHGGKSTAELRLTVCVRPPRGLPSRWKDSMRQSMLTGFIKPSTQIKLDYAVSIITRALCSRPLRLVRRRANIARIVAEAVYSEHEGVIIEVRRDRQFYNIHMR